MNNVLFQPFRLRDLTLPNRIVLAPMTRGRAGLTHQFCVETPDPISSSVIREGASRGRKGCEAPRGCWRRTGPWMWSRALSMV